MITGVITTRHVLLHTRSIVQGFGVRTWWNCWRAVVSGRRTTFLELVWE